LAGLFAGLLAGLLAELLAGLAADDVDVFARPFPVAAASSSACSVVETGLRGVALPPRLRPRPPRRRRRGAPVPVPEVVADAGSAGSAGASDPALAPGGVVATPSAATGPSWFIR
jgi:hypothetical protein